MIKRLINEGKIWIFLGGGNQKREMDICVPGICSWTDLNAMSGPGLCRIAVVSDE